MSQSSLPDSGLVIFHKHAMRIFLADKLKSAWRRAQDAFFRVADVMPPGTGIPPLPNYIAKQFDEIEKALREGQCYLALADLVEQLEPVADPVERAYDEDAQVVFPPNFKGGKGGDA